ncbi:hypothetical protein Trydic_g707 [Trypoxylus dichotomus]
MMKPQYLLLKLQQLRTLLGILQRERSVSMSDSRSVLESIQNRKHPTKTDTTVLDIHNELNKLWNAEAYIKFYWVKSHVGIQSNIVADCLAKESTHLLVISGIPLLAVNLITLMKHRFLKKEWQNHWKASYTRHMTNYAKSHFYMHQNNWHKQHPVPDSPLCACGESLGDLNHWFLECHKFS